MQHETFTVVYDGEALSSHTMDVRDLAPALLSLSSIFDEASDLLYGDKVDISLHVKALEPGCFSVDFAVVQSLLSQMKDMLNGDWVQAAMSLKELIIGAGAGGYSLVKLIKKLQGSNPDKITRLSPGMVRIEFKGDTFDIPVDLLSIYQDISIRKSIEKVVSPLQKDGIDSIDFKVGGIQVESLDKKDFPSFKVPEIAEEILLKETRKAAFSIVALAFKEENKWRLHDGNNTIYATIKDEDFLHKVENNEKSFRKSDVLICEVEDISTRDEMGLRTEHNVTKVIEHRPAMRQIPLVIEQQSTDDDSDVEPKES